MSESGVLPSSAFYTADHVDQNNAPIKDDVCKLELDVNSENFSDFFEIERVSDWILKNEFKKVALQLPDVFLEYALPLSLALEKKTKSKIYILADTSYRSCCVDAVAAEHASCDCLVHFGEACLSSPSEALPVLYVYGKLLIDWTDFEQKLKNANFDQRTVVVLYEPGYDAVVNQIEKIMSDNILNSVHVAKLASQNSPIEKSLGRELPQPWSNESANLLFIGSAESTLLTIWLMTHTRFDKVYHYSPSQKQLEIFEPVSHKQLRKRLFLIEKLKDANVVGLVVGTLGVDGIKDAIGRIRKLCKEAQKKLYVLSIGKVNEPKLSNFASDIDCFILLSCPFGIILNTNDYFKPIVSFFEAEIALNPSKSWFAADGWTAQFSDVINDDIGKLDKDAVDFSLVSGKMRTARIDDHDQDDNADKQLLEYSAGNYFMNRTWKGLDNTYVEEDLTLNQGLQGIAMEYSSENPGSKN